MAYYENLPTDKKILILEAQKKRKTDLDALSKSLHIGIIATKDMEGDGYLVYDANKKKDRFDIYVNSTHPKARQRFTIAHEIAHYLLHEDDVKKAGSIDRGVRSGYLDYRETQANMLGAEILLPLNSIEKAIKEGKNTIAELAKEFGVSEDVLKIRLDI